MNNAIKYLIEELVRIYKVDVSIFDYDYMCSINSYDELEKYLSKLISDYNLRNFINEVCDYTRGIEILKCLINMGSIEAINRIGVAYYKGEGVPLDYEEAIKWFTEAANQGYTSAQYNLALMYKKGEGVEQNYIEAFKWYTIAANKGNIYAQYNLALMYEKGEGVEQNYEEAIKWYTIAANKGHTSAQCNLALMYRKGEGVKQNYEEAIKWYTIAANKGNTSAQYNLALMYEKGEGVEQNYEEAIKWYTIAANKGHTSAQYNLALMYKKGEGVEQNYEEAIKWYTIAANKGNTSAQYNLALMYYKGYGVEQNYEEAFRWCTEAANKGDTSAQNNLGVMYEKGEGVEQNYEEAIKWYTKAANQGNTSAQNNLASMYYKGYGVEQNYEEAIKWYTIAANKGHTSAQYNLALMYEKGEGVEQNYEKAIKWYTEAANQGNIYAQYNLALMYRKGEGVEQNYEEAIKWFTEAANQGNTSAQYNLGVMYYKGKGVEQNYIEAIKWYTIAANKGHTSAQYNLALMYEKGEGVEQNYIEAFKWYTEAANQGDTSAQYSLALMYYKGKGVEQNYEEAIRWFTEAANQGDTSAQYNLGVMYYKGKGVEQNYIEAIRWFTEAANKGHTSAQYNLALMYKKGEGVEQNYEEAIKWYTEAANQGDTSAQNNLGVMYEKGEGVEQNYIEAFKWYTIAANQGNISAQYNLGVMYENGKGVEQNYIEAIKWYTIAANKGHTFAQYNLALMYKKGEGVEQNYEEAIKWYTEAANKGHTSAQYNLALMYDLGEGVEQNHEEAIKWYTEAANKGHTFSQCYLALMYENGIGTAIDLEKALKYYMLALDNGFEKAREFYENLLNRIEIQDQRKKLNFGERKDVFVSWNHLDQNIKNNLCKELESRNLFTVWESDTNGIGEIDEVIKEAILQSRSYLIILTGNSIYSKWVEKELNIIFEKADNSKEYEYTIRPIVFNIKVINGKEEYFDVIKAINGFANNSPFKKLLDYCFHFDNGKLDYDKLVNLLKEGISNSLKIEYRDKVLSDTQRYNAAINNVIKDDSTKSGIIASTFKYEEGYLNRPLYDNDGNGITSDEIFTNNRNVLIYGEGGTGKSLYLKNYLRTKFNGDRYLFYLPCKEMNNHLDKDISDIIREVCFDKYFSIDERKLLTPNAFEQIFHPNNKIILLIDALDEVSLELRKKLIDKLNSLHLRYKNIFTLFTTRNKSDAQIISSEFNQVIGVYELKNLTGEDIEKIFDIFNSKANFKEDDSELSKKMISKKEFFISLDNVSDEIKTNPLLLSNLILIYFATKKIMKTTHDVIRESINIVFKEIDNEKEVSFKYKEYIEGNKLNELLGYFSLQRANNNQSSSNEIIQKCLEEKYKDDENILEKDFEKIANEIYKYLRRRSIITNNRIMHDIFANYFVAVYLYNKIYKNKTNYYGFPYIDYKVENEFNTFCKLYFTNEDEPWPNISTDLVYKLDYEIYRINDRAEMNEEHFSYDVFHKTLTKIQDDGFSETAIKIIEEVIKKDAFHFNEFIKKYFYK